MDLLLSFPVGVCIGYGIGMVVVQMQFKIMSNRIDSDTQIIVNLKAQLRNSNELVAAQEKTINDLIKAITGKDQ